MIVYEEYDTPAEKRKAQVGAKRGYPTGKARGYFFIFNENGRNNTGGYDGYGNLFDGKPGTTDTRMASTSASMDYLRHNCRRVGGRHLKGAWRELWLWYKKE